MDIDETIARYGVFVQAVVSQHPYDTPFAYTVGRHLGGEPELIAFGGTYELVGAVLNELALDHEPYRIRAGAVVSTRTFDGLPVRLVHARPEWAASHGLVAFHHAGRGSDGLPFLQVQFPDMDGRLPGQDGRPDDCFCCPDLSRPDRPWALPFPSADAVVLRGPTASRVLETDELDVLVPVRVDDQDVHRFDRVHAHRVDDDVVVLDQPPVIADWTTAGAMFEIRGDDTELGLPVARVELRPSPKVHLTWGLELDAHRCLEHQDVTVATLQPLTALGDVEATVDPRWLAVAAPSGTSERVRSTMRRLTRDGLARDASRYSRPGLFDGPCDLHP